MVITSKRHEGSSFDVFVPSGILENPWCLPFGYTDLVTPDNLEEKLGNANQVPGSLGQ